MERKIKKADIMHSNGVDLRSYEDDARNWTVLDLLETSYKNCPMVWDQVATNPKNHVPRKIEETYEFPTVAKHDRNENFARFDIDTLFFVFYFQQGTYQQHMAARELKNKQWRFSKELQAWIQ